MRNKYEIRGETAYIQISCKEKQFETLVDAEDIPMLLDIDVNWCAKYSESNKSYYVCATKSIGNRKNDYYILHRVIMNASKGIQVDHINHNTLDNRKSELKLVTAQENTQNRVARGKSGYRGVTWLKHACKWQVHLMVNGKNIYLGLFDDIEEANKVSMMARSKYMPNSKEARIGVNYDSLVLPRKRQTNVESGVRGITWDKQHDKWTVRAYISGARTFIGRFEDLEEAKNKLKLINGG